MTRAYILIETSGGQAYKYVRDVVNDTNGVNEQFYRYEGNGYQELNISVPSELKFTSLIFDTLYSIKVNVDAGGILEYSFTFPAPSNEIGILNIRNGSITWANLLEKLQQVSGNVFTVRLIDEDIRFISNGSGASTAIAITAGASGIDLLVALNSTPSSAVTSDNYDNQTGAGLVATDLNALLTNWGGTDTVEVNTFTVDITTNADDIGGKYLTINSPFISYYIWYDVDDTDTDPAVAGKIGIEVDVLQADTESQVAVKSAVAITAVGSGTVFSTGDSTNTFTVTNVTPGNTTDATIGTLNGAPATFVLSIDQQGTGIGNLIVFPENAGGTHTLRRKNYSNAIDDNTETLIQLIKANVASIKVVEETEQGYVPQ